MSVYIPDIPNDFPTGLSIERLNEIISTHMEFLEDTHLHDGNDVEISSARIASAQNEINRRQSKNNAKTSKILSLLTIILAVITIIFAGLSIYFQINDQKFDKEWMQQQSKSNIELLNKVDSIYQTYKTAIDTNKKIDPAN